MNTDAWWSNSFVQWALLLGPFIFGGLTSQIWSSKGGRAARGFLMGFFLGPIGMLYVGFAKPQGHSGSDVVLDEDDIVESIFKLTARGTEDIPRGTRMRIVGLAGRDVILESAAGQRTQVPRKYLRLLERTSGADTKSCPQCAEDVRKAAKICRYCGNQFS